MLFCLYLHHQNAIAVRLANAKVAQLVERNLAKVEVASSNLVFRSDPFSKGRDLKFKRVLLSLLGWWNW